jgi:ferritin heavy chain
LELQNVRGGRVKLQTMQAPEMEYDHKEKGEALYAMELALSLEKLNFLKLRALHDIGAKHNDAQMCDFLGESRARLPFDQRTCRVVLGKRWRRCWANGGLVAPSAEGNLLADQARDVKAASEMVSQLRRVGKGLGVFEFDKLLANA